MKGTGEAVRKGDSARLPRRAPFLFLKLKGEIHEKSYRLTNDGFFPFDVIRGCLVGPADASGEIIREGKGPQKHKTQENENRKSSFRDSIDAGDFNTRGHPQKTMVAFLVTDGIEREPKNQKN